ncbi:NERD domain-containing protein, partial [bacterium]|nr:NERD domain-containing protein [bacterium]
MDFPRAERAVDLGERLVSQELNRIAPTYGARVLDNLLLRVEPGITARLDHVVVDQHGALIVNVKAADGAKVIGNDVQRHWEARHPDGRAERFLNPVARNREHETVVRQALRETGNWFGPDYVKSAVVFGGADLTSLALDTRTRTRVVNLSDFETLIRERHQTAPSTGTLSDGQVAGLAGLFRGLDHSGDRAVLQRHA